MVAITVIRVYESPVFNLLFNLFFLGFLIYLLRSFLSFLLKIFRKKIRQSKLVSLEEFTKMSYQISSWLKKHEQDLKLDPIGTLSNQEFVELIKKDQELYEQVIKDWPDYPDTVMAPNELHRYLIEIIQGRYKQTH